MQKTRKAVAKRFKITASGKIKMKRCNLQHILTDKSRDQKRGFRKVGYVAESQRQLVLRNLPYGSIR